MQGSSPCGGRGRRAGARCSGREGVRARSSGVSATALCSAAGGGGLLRTRACTHARAWSRLAGRSYCSVKMKAFYANFIIIPKSHQD